MSNGTMAISAALIADPFAYCFAQFAKTGILGAYMVGIDPAVAAGISDVSCGEHRIMILNSLECDLIVTSFPYSSWGNVVTPIVYTGDPPATPGGSVADANLIPGVRTYPSPAKHRAMQTGAPAKMGGLGVYSFDAQVNGFTQDAGLALSFQYGGSTAAIAFHTPSLIGTGPSGEAVYLPYMAVCADLGAKYTNLADFVAKTVSTTDGQTYCVTHASDVANSTTICASFYVTNYPESLVVWIYDANSTLGMAPE